jgi:hypothetical protein
MADPKYVRLADHLTRGMRADLNSGFSIAGFDVVEMPDKEEEPEQYKFVRSEIASGRLEQASKAEYEEVHPDLYADLGVEVERPALVVQAAPAVQETHIQAAAAKGARKVRAARAEVSEDALEADEARREAAIAAQKAQASGSPKRRKSAAAEAAAAAQQVEEDEAEAQAAGGAPAVEEDDPQSRQRHQ